MKTANQKLIKGWEESKLVIVGLDTDPDKIPVKILDDNSFDKEAAILDFNKKIIDNTKDLCLGFKINSAFYEERGIEGMKTFFDTVKYINKVAPDCFTIADVKRGDIGNTNKGYTKYMEEFDSMTISGYFGKDANEPFFNEEFKDKYIIVLAKTSNSGSADIQDLEADGLPVYLHMAKKVKTWGSNYALVVGGTHPNHLMRVRHEIGQEGIILCPGVGAQGADLKSIIQCGVNEQGHGVIINASRSIIYASKGRDFAEAARLELGYLNNEITEHLKLPRILWENERAGTYEQETLKILAEVNAVHTNDHFVYTAGDHGDTYINKDAVTLDPARIDKIGLMIADLLKDKGIETVVAPALGGIVLGHIVAKYLTHLTGHTVYSVFAEKDGTDGFKFTRGYDKFVVGKNIVVVEDILNSGKSLINIVEYVRSAGGIIVTTAVMCNRGGVVSEDIGNVELVNLSIVDLRKYSENNCALCKQGVPVNISLGHGKAYLERNKQKS